MFICTIDITYETYLSDSLNFKLDGIDQYDAIMNDNSKNNDSNNNYIYRNEILHNIDGNWCAIRMNDWKLIIGEWSKYHWNNLYQYNSIGNFNHPTIKCHGIIPEYYTNSTKNGDIRQCLNNDNRAICLFNIKYDPCEYYNLLNNYELNYFQKYHQINITSNEIDIIYNKLHDRILYYKNTMVPALNNKEKQDINGSDPRKHDSFWSPWMGPTLQELGISNSDFEIHFGK